MIEINKFNLIVLMEFWLKNERQCSFKNNSLLRKYKNNFKRYDCLVKLFLFNMDFPTFKLFLHAVYRPSGANIPEVVFDLTSKI